MLVAGDGSADALKVTPPYPAKPFAPKDARRSEGAGPVRAQKAPRREKTAGMVLSRIVRSSPIDQRSR